MKNLKSTEPIYLDGQHGWCADIYEGEKSSVETDICTVWGSTEEELNYRVTMIKKAYEMQKALEDIVEKQYNGIHTLAALNGSIKNAQSLLKEMKL